MNKSVYSLVLMDDVVEAVDKMAYAMGTSRSALINRILAEKLACRTPEMRMNDIFSEIESFISGGSFLVARQQSEAMLSIRSALKYKYNPTMRYSLELYREGGKTIGELRAAFRTTSAELVGKLTDFLTLWAALEQKYIVAFFPEGIHYRISGGKFTRTFRLPPDKENMSGEEIGRSIAEYISMFDEILKIYFSAADDTEQAQQLAAEEYLKYIKNGIVLI